MRTLVFGDIHGCYKSLVNLLDLLNVNTSTDRLIFLGDYIDRGDSSNKVIELLISLDQTHNCDFLRGNHEIMMLDALKNSTKLSYWLHYGGEETLDSYRAKSFKDIPDNHWNFLRQLKPYAQSDKHVYVHASLIANIGLSEQPDSALYWTRVDNTIFPHCSGKLMVCGHTAQTSGYPLNLTHGICIDTGAGYGGWLTCLDVNENFCYQSNELGETRQFVMDVTTT